MKGSFIEKMIKQIYVVEGKNDVAKLKQIYPEINVVSVGGSAIKKDVLDYLISLQDSHEVILCFDPDFPGLKIRKELEKALPKANHIFLDRNKSYNKNKTKIGLEHLSEADIIAAFNNIYVKQSLSNKFKLADLYNLKLIGNDNSAKLRNIVSSKLNLGHVNGKTLLRRLNESQYSLNDLENIINKIKE